MWFFRKVPSLITPAYAITKTINLPNQPQPPIMGELGTTRQPASPSED